jgi:N-acetyl-anhydromuramyl-L-alanine amidase AmpD
VIRPAFYGIYEVRNASVELYQMIGGRYSLVPANQRGHFPIAPLGVELGIWRGAYLGATLHWMRFWDNQGNLLLTGFERAEQAEAQLAQERQRVQLLAERLIELGIDPDTV